MEAIENRLRRLEACESIRECVQLYALAGDRKNDGATLRHVFAADAIYELVGMGRFEGIEAILKGLAEIAQSAVVWSYHLPGGPLIKLADTLDRAEVFWWVWCPARVRNDDGSTAPYWGAVHYNGEMIEQDGVWKFRRLLLETRLRVPFEGPWSEIEGPFQWPGWAHDPRSPAR
ncbi:MAG: nuclear transport factor 2 family protein [Rhizomicrobium sp.]